MQEKKLKKQILLCHLRKFDYLCSTKALNRCMLLGLQFLGLLSIEGCMYEP